MGENNIIIKEVIADRGYGSAENIHHLENKDINFNIPLWSSRSGGTFFNQLEMGFTVNEDRKIVHCPENYEMKFSFHEESTGRDILYYQGACANSAQEPINV